MKLQHYGEREQSDNFNRTESGAKSTPLYERGRAFEKGNPNLVPVVYPPEFIEPETREEILARHKSAALIIENRLLRWAMHDRAKEAALNFWSGYDRRQEKEIIKAAGSESTFYRGLRELRALAETWRVELEGATS